MGFKLSITRITFFGVGIADLQQVADLLGKVHGGALFGDGDVALPDPRFAGQKQVGGPPAFAFVAHPFGLTRLGRDRDAVLGPD